MQGLKRETPREYGALLMSIGERRWALLAPDVDAGEEEEPDHINKVPVPSCGFKSDMSFGCEVPCLKAEEANREEDRTDHNVEAMEACRHEEVCTVDVSSKTEGSVAVFVGLECGEKNAEGYGNDEAPLHPGGCSRAP